MKTKTPSFATRELHRLRRDFPLLTEYSRSRPPCQADGELIFRLPLPPNMANARLHWRSKDALRKTYFSQCETLQSLRLLPELPCVPFPRARIAVTLFVKREHDHDNAVARCKFACDFLQRAGYIENDKPKFLEWAGMPQQVVGDKSVPRVVIILKEME